MTSPDDIRDLLDTHLNLAIKGLHQWLAPLEELGNDALARRVRETIRLATETGDPIAIGPLVAAIYTAILAWAAEITKEF